MVECSPSPRLLKLVGGLQVFALLRTKRSLDYLKPRFADRTLVLCRNMTEEKRTVAFVIEMAEKFLLGAFLASF